jgi:AraC-like DNA-binding protein
MVMVKGKLRVLISGQEVDAGPGDVLFYPPHVAHGERAVRPGTDFIFFAFRDQTNATLPFVLHDSSGRVRVLARWLCDEQASAYEDRRRNMDALLQALVLEIVKLSRFKPRGPLESIRALLRENLERAPTLDELAARADLSKYHLIRAYKRATGRTPMEDLRVARLEAACDLLLTTDLPLKQIARRVGFCDEYYFSRAFRKTHGVPPGSFRNRR